MSLRDSPTAVVLWLIAMVVAIVAFGYVLIVGDDATTTVADSTGASIPEKVVPLDIVRLEPIVVPATLVGLVGEDLLLSLPTPSQLLPDLIEIEGPPHINVPYEAWYVAQLHFRPGEQYRAVRTAWCESQYIDTAVGAAGEIGRWQIHPIHFETVWLADIVESWYPGASQSIDGIIEALKNPHVNAQAAVYLLDIEETNYGTRDWRDWSTRYGCEEWQG